MLSLIRVKGEVHFLTGLEGPRMGEGFLKKAPPVRAK